MATSAGWALIRGEQRWQGVPPGRVSANSPELLIRVAGAGIVAVLDCFALPEVRMDTLRRVLLAWCLPSHAGGGVSGRKVMPAKTRAFIGALQTALGRAEVASRGLVLAGVGLRVFAGRTWLGGNGNADVVRARAALPRSQPPGCPVG
jgi:hypothetical protein